MDKIREIPTSRNASDEDSDSDVSVAELPRVISAQNERLKRIIGKVDMLAGRKNEAWRLGSKVKAELEFKCEEYEEKMLEVGRTLRSDPMSTTSTARESPQVLGFSECSSDRSADIALCEDADMSGSNQTNSFESGGYEWLTSEVMGISPIKEADTSAQGPSSEIGDSSFGEKLDLEIESSEAE